MSGLAVVLRHSSVLFSCCCFEALKCLVYLQLFRGTQVSCFPAVVLRHSSVLFSCSCFEALKCLV